MLALQCAWSIFILTCEADLRDLFGRLFAYEVHCATTGRLLRAAGGNCSNRWNQLDRNLRSGVSFTDAERPRDIISTLKTGLRADIHSDAD